MPVTVIPVGKLGRMATQENKSDGDGSVFESGKTWSEESGKNGSLFLRDDTPFDRGKRVRPNKKLKI